jgi:hypothetical protein
MRTKNCPRHASRTEAKHAEPLKIMSPAGLEPTTYGLKVPESSDPCSVFTKAHCADPQLARIVKDWPNYSSAKKSSICAIAAATID